MSFLSKVMSKYQVVTNTAWYHGRSADSDKFDLNYVGKDEAKDREGPGFYFTRDKKDAEHYAHPSGIVLTVDLSPRRLVSSTDPAPVNHIRYLIDHAPDKETTLSNWDEDAKRALKLALQAMTADNAKETFENIWFDFYRYAPKKYLEALIHLGYDGHLASRNQNHIIIYNPSVIKILDKERY